MDERTKTDLKKGNVVLGGCCPKPGIEFHCKACKKEFGTFWKECDIMDSDIITVTLKFKKNKSDLLNPSITTVLKRLVDILLPYSTCIFRKRKHGVCPIFKK